MQSSKNHSITVIQSDERKTTGRRDSVYLNNPDTAQESLNNTNMMLSKQFKEDFRNCEHNQYYNGKNASI